jgi:putative transposase
MVAFIDKHRDEHGVEPICEVLPIAPSTYFEHKARQADRSRLPAREHADVIARGHVRRVWQDSGGR